MLLYHLLSSSKSMVSDRTFQIKDPGRRPRISGEGIVQAIGEQESEVLSMKPSTFAP